MMDEDVRWSVVIPYFNEEDFLPATLRSLMAQTLKPFRLILVDNASTDGSRAVAQTTLEDAPGVETLFLEETEKGQAPALKTGIAAVETPFVAICDADTFYPPHYLATADRLLREGGQGAVAALAMTAPLPEGRLAHRVARAKGALMGRILAKQCHAGGPGHAFRTEALRAAGGYDKALWPYVLKDHELMNRVLKRGRALYAYDHWCSQSDRRGDRRAVRWTVFERALYHLTPFARKDWFFHRFLAPRFARRRQDELALRTRTWEKDGTGAGGRPPPHAERKSR